jgi:hypothetical protein
MTTMKRFSMLIIAMSCWGCSEQQAQTRQAPGPVIVRVVNRDTTITARAGTNGPVYSMENSHGQVLVPAMTMNQMQATHPDLARQIQATHAKADTGAWAGIDTGF